MRNAYKWWALALLFVGYFLELGSRNVYGATLPNIQASFGVTSSQIGIVGTVATVVYGVLAPLSGMISDILSRKWTVVCGVAVFSLGIFLSGFTTGLVGLVLVYGVLVAAGQPFFYPPTSSLVSQLHRDSKATALSILQMGLYAGIILCSFTAGFFADLGGDGWRKAFWLIGAAGLVWAGVLAVFLRNTPQEAVAGAEARPTVLECVKALVSKPSAIVYTVYLGLMIFVFIGYSTWTPTLLKDKYPELSMKAAATHAVLWHYLGAAVGVMLGSTLGDRFAKRRPTIRLEMTIFGVAGSIPALLLLVKAPSLAVACGALLAYGLFRGFFDSNLYIGLIEVIKPRFRASAMGLTLGAAYVFGGLAPWGLGLIRERFSMEAGFLLFAALYVLTILLILFARKFYFKKDYEG